MEYYNVLDRSEYSMTVKHCPDIVDLSDNFLDLDQLEAVSEDFNSSEYMRSHEQKVFFLKPIMDTCNDWVASIKPGCMSTRKVPTDVTRLIEAVGIHRVNQYLRTISDENAGILYTATSNEIRNARARPKQPYKRSDRLLVRDYKNLLKFCMLCMQAKHCVVFEWCLYPDSAENIIRFCKKNIAWNDIMHAHKHNRGHWSFSPMGIPKEDMIWIKRLWDSPELQRVFLEPVEHTIS